MSENGSRITDEFIEDVQKYARAISGGDDMYMDFAQDALTRIVEKEDEYDPASEASFNTWATRIAIHTIINSIRSHRASKRREKEWAYCYYPEVRPDPGVTDRPVVLWDDDEAKKYCSCKETDCTIYPSVENKDTA